MSEQKRAVTSVKISPCHAAQFERGLFELRYACMCLDDLIDNEGVDKCSAVLALVQKAGALIETALRAAAVLDGIAIVGTAAEWLDITNDQEVEP